MDNQEFVERRMCDAQTIEKHMEYMHKLDKRIDKLVTIQEGSIANVNRLTKDIKDTMCNKSNCQALHDRLDRIENSRVTILKGYDDDIAHLNDKVKRLWFFELTARNPKMVGLMAIGGLTLFVVASPILREFVVQLFTKGS